MLKNLKKKIPREYRIWLNNKRELERAVDFLSQNRWVLGGNIYIRKQKQELIHETPILITVNLQEDIPKYEYVSLGFVLDEEIAQAISVIEQIKAKKDISGAILISKFPSSPCQKS